MEEIKETEHFEYCELSIEDKWQRRIIDAVISGIEKMVQKGDNAKNIILLCKFALSIIEKYRINHPVEPIPVYDTEYGYKTPTP